jgi:hypothetical protein
MGCQLTPTPTQKASEMPTLYNLWTTAGEVIAHEIFADDFIVCGNGRYFNYDGQSYFCQGFVPFGDSEVNLYGFTVVATPLEIDRECIMSGEVCPVCKAEWHANDDGSLTMQHHAGCGHIIELEASAEGFVM